MALVSGLNLYPSSSAASKGLSDAIGEVWKQAPKAAYHQPSAKNFKQFRRLISSIAASLDADAEAIVQHHQKAAAKAGFILESISDSGTVFIILREEAPYQGGGIYVFRTHTRGKRPLLLQAPHYKSDVRSGEIATYLFQQSDATALFCNSMKRECSGKDQAGDVEDSPCDMAHNPKALYQAATIGFCMTYPETLIVQIHGFKANSAIKGSDGRLIILSQGRSFQSDRWPINLAALLFAEVYGEQVLVYDRDTNFYGATSNVQAHYVNRLGRGGFLHIELSRTLREHLVSEPDAAFQFLTLLRRVIAAYQNSEKKVVR